MTSGRHVKLTPSALAAAEAAAVATLAGAARATRAEAATEVAVAEAEALANLAEAAAQNRDVPRPPQVQPPRPRPPDTAPPHKQQKQRKFSPAAREVLARRLGTLRDSKVGKFQLAEPVGEARTPMRLWKGYQRHRPGDHLKRKREHA
eukprot:TRINITY_DN77417_c0_g1_i1.p1 TRINITY_DN77417_c0_g1~~TRINITY_DN77417_c0_g1_i1.p1  ORF type:complete len:157 (-),score=32.71 TRINITY_DN77417_c0_g1_i1:198-641(-)